MRNKRIKRCFSFIIAIVMVVTMFPVLSVYVSASNDSVVLYQYQSVGGGAGPMYDGTVTLTRIGKTDDDVIYGSMTFNNCSCLLQSKSSQSSSYSGWNVFNKTTIYFAYEKSGKIRIGSINGNGKLSNYLYVGKVYFKNGTNVKSITKIDSINYYPGASAGGLKTNPGPWCNKVYFKNTQSSNVTSWKSKRDSLLKNQGDEGILQMLGASVANVAKKGTKQTTQTITVKSNPTFSAPPICTIPAGATVVATEVSNGYGKVNYNGNTGWINLSYCTNICTVTKPEPPVVKLETEPDIPANGTITVSWNEVYDAKYYKAVLCNSFGTEVKAYSNLYGTTVMFVPQDEGVYTVKVYAQNSMYTSDPGVLAQAITVHGKSKVTYLNYDGTVIGTQDVSYANSSTAPLAPEREGYSFYGWSESLDNVKSARVITAKYTINKYAVKFFDDIEGKGSQIGSTQMVNYHESATPPEPPQKEGYNFVGWSSDDYKNVYRENKSESINIYPVYVWKNVNIPVTCSITKAARQKDGYYVIFDIENHVSDITRGRAVVTLKTSSGKLIYTTESAAFSIPGNSKETGVKVFVPCEKAASKAEVIILDSFENSIPKSKVVSSGIDQSNMWTSWTDYSTLPSFSSDTQYETRTMYRYQTKEFSTNNTNTKVGWTLYGSRTPYVVATGWADYVDVYDYPNKTRAIVDQRKVDLWSSRTKYDYFHYYKAPGTVHWSPVLYDGYNSTPHTISIDYGLSWQGNSSVSGWSRYGTYGCPWGDNGSNYWYPNGTHSESYVYSQKTQYKYQDTEYTYYFYRWTNFSDWQTAAVTANDNRRVETKKQYRTKSISAQVEDDSGISRTVSGKVDSSLAGKIINLYVTKYNANSDFTNEYVGQTTISSNGSYSFTFKLREEPSAETGDMTAYIGIEGSKEMQAVKVFEAPKPKYTVKFYSDTDSESPISTQVITEGETAKIPSVNPEKEGYIFAGWNNTCTNVRSDLDVRPIFVEQQYVVRYIDPRNPENNKVELCTYGTPFEPGVIKECESGYARGWDIVEYETSSTDGKKEVFEGEKVVTENTVVMAEYETKTFDVSFRGVNGEEISTQSVEYDGFVELPELPEKDGVEFIEWDVSAEELAEVKDSITVNAVYFFDKTTSTPKASLSNGAYNGTQTVALSCDTKDSVIWYTLDGTDPSENPDAIEYTGPITISDTTVLNYYAGSINANDSDIVQNCYVINGNGKLVTVHNTVDEDCDVTFIVDSMSDIDDEMFEYTGYDFTGFYYDEACTQSANLTTDAFGSSVELYSKYTISSYDVVFKDGSRIIKSETAEYGSSVTPPNMANKGELVFLGWSGGDYEFVSEDIELTAVYKPKSEIVNIELNKYNYTLEEGSTFKLNATVTPEEKSDLTVIWISENDKIASVLDDGTVTANSAGTVKIYAVTEDDSAIAECSVTVSKSPNKSLSLKETAVIGLDTEGNLRGIPLDNNTVEFVSSQFRNTVAYLKFTKADGTVLNGTDKVGTGTTISLMNGNRELDTWTIVLTGDINNDGLVNVKDVAKVSRFVVKKDTPDYYQTVASDVNGDGKVNNRDAAYLSRYLVGKEDL